MKLVTLDFWKTLATPSPEYAKARIKILQDRFGLNKESIKRGIAEAKATLDHDAELGFGASCERNLSFLARTLGVECLNPYGLLNKLADAFIKNPPTILKETKGAIDNLISRKPGIQIHIISNTNFIPGWAIKEACFQEWNPPPALWQTL